MFQLTAAEKAEVVANCDHLQKLNFSKAVPFNRRMVTYYEAPGAQPTTHLLAQALGVSTDVLMGLVAPRRVGSNAG